MTEFLTDAAWIFFAVLSLIIGSLSVVAFGADLLPSKVTGNDSSARSISNRVNRY
jgi:hypothetical protein